MNDWIDELKKQQQNPTYKPVTEAQTKYLKDLGHNGPAPQDRKEASILIAKLIDAQALTQKQKPRPRSKPARKRWQPTDNTARIMHDETTGPSSDASCPF